MFEKEIAKGVALLDEKRPGWLDVINLDRLDLNYPLFYPNGSDCGCICAQTNYFFNPEKEIGDYGSEIIALEVNTISHGFSLNFGDVVIDAPQLYRALTKEWKQTILRLRAERSSVPAQEHELATAGD